MKSNGLLKILVPSVLLIVVLIVIKSVGGNKTVQQGGPEDLTLSRDEARALGLGDTPKDTLATIVAQMKGARSDLEEVKRQNDQLMRENDRLRSREQSIDTRINQAVQSASRTAKEEAEAAKREAERVSRETKGLLGELQDKFNAFGKGGSNSSNGSDLPIGLGLEGLGGLGLNEDDGKSFETGPTGQIVWTEPSDAIQTKGKSSGTTVGSGSFSFPNTFEQLNQGVDSALGPLGDAQKDLRYRTKGERDLEGRDSQGRAKRRSEDTQPIYTIAENSTLMGSVAMTALIGRVPIGGTVNDPYPFKVIIGKDNLAANGFDLPEVASAVMSGTASGDWTLSCVRGKLESITFIFEDGTIRTLPEPSGTVSSNGNRNTGDTARIRGGLGYLSDPHGIPCISGERKSNGQEYITTQSLITAAGAGVAALLSQDDGSNYSGSGTVVSDRNAALNNILTGGVNDIRSWVNRLYGEAFAAIYVEPHAQVAIHIEQELKIDYEPYGRKVAFHDAKNSATELD